MQAKKEQLLNCTTYKIQLKSLKEKEKVEKEVVLLCTVAAPFYFALDRTSKKINERTKR